MKIIPSIVTTNRSGQCLRTRTFHEVFKFGLGSVPNGGYIKADDVVMIVKSPEMQANLRQVGVCKPTITERTACNWLKKLNWRFEPKKKKERISMDMSERTLYGIETHLSHTGRNMKSASTNGIMTGVPFLFPLVFLSQGAVFVSFLSHTTSQLSSKMMNRRHWAHSSTTATPKPKGNGQSLMVSDFLTVEWGCLVHGTEYVFFLPLLPSYHVSLLQTHTVKPGSCSRLEKITRVTLVLMNSSSKLTM